MTPAKRANLILALALIVVIVRAAVYSPVSPPESAFGKAARLYGKVLEIKENPTRGYNAIVRVDRVGEETVEPFRVSVLLLSDSVPMAVESPVVLSGETLSAASDSRSLPYEITDAQRLLRIDCGASAMVVKTGEIVGKGARFEMPQTDRLISLLAEIPGLSPQGRGFLAGALFGQKGELSPSMRDEFAQSGLAHVLAVSGLHVGIIYALILLALMPLRLVRLRFGLVEMAALVLTWGYVLICNQTPAYRAALMLTVVVLALCLHRKVSPLRALLIAAVVILAVSPGALRDVGFQMSFAAAGALVVGMPGVAALCRNIPSGWRLLIETVAVTVLATMATLPLAAVYFHFVSLAGVMTNFVAGLLLPLILGFGLLATGAIAVGLSGVAKVMALPVEYGVEALTRLGSAVSATEGTRLWLPEATPMTVVACVFLALGIVAMAWGCSLNALRMKAIRLGLTTTICGAVTLCIAIAQQPERADHEVYAVTTVRNVVAVETDGPRMTIWVEEGTKTHRKDAVIREAEWRWAEFMRLCGLKELEVSELARCNPAQNMAD